MRSGTGGKMVYRTSNTLNTSGNRICRRWGTNGYWVRRRGKVGDRPRAGRG